MLHLVGYILEYTVSCDGGSCLRISPFYKNTVFITLFTSAHQWHIFQVTELQVTLFHITLLDSNGEGLEFHSFFTSVLDRGRCS